MEKTAKGLIEHCKNASNWKYVYGMKGTVMSQAEYSWLKRQYGSMVWDSDISKIGQVCCDCSGLISSYTGVLRGSTSYEALAPEKVSIEELKANWSKYIGWALWLPGHIGVVSDTEGYYYAMDGSARNWKHYPLSRNGWTKCIKIVDIDYSKPKEEEKGEFDMMNDFQKELFVKNVMYFGLLDREVDEAGLKYWIDRINKSKSINDVLLEFMEVKEFRERTVIVAYERLLNRRPDTEGLKSWTEWLKGEKTADDLCKAIKSTDEYKNLHIN